MREHSRRTPGSLFALYETPNGVRVLALHRTFQPRSDEVTRLFSELGADPAYSRLCRLQACFRTRVSPKPWRIGLSVLLFVCLLVAYALGWIEPTGLPLGR